VDFTRSMPQRVVSHCTAIDLAPCRVSPRAVVTVSQMTRPNHVSPKSANEESFS
jgi:hypothetical protein